MASHYWLRPDGTFGKFPIIVFDEFNKVVEIRERKTFQEEANLRLVNGILIPGLIDFIPDSIFNHEDQFIKRYIDKQIIGGAVALGSSNQFYNKAKQIAAKDIQIVECAGDEITGSSEFSVFQKIQNSSDSASSLLQYTVTNSIKLKVDNFLGSLEIGKSPGLFSISKVDYQNFEISPSSKIKRIL